MSKFIAGQRVRCNVPGAFVHGCEATVLGLGSYGPLLRIDGHGTHAPCGLPWQAYPHEVEPLTPEGWQTVEWSDCLWQPEGIAA